MKLVLASGNLGKVAEFRRILAGLDVELLDATDVDLPEVEETGATFAENAVLKARAARDATGLASVADDSGLVVDALGGEPGIYSARYAGRHGDDAANLALVLERMAGRRDRSARFVCVAALAAPDGREWTAEGTLEGVLTTAPRGTGGFGYDPILQPAGETRTTAELAPDEKDAISHRGQAFRGLRAAIAALVLLAGCAGTGSSGPDTPVSADPPAASQPAAGGGLVQPQPGLVDARPVNWERAEPVGDGDRLRVTWFGGVAECYGLDRVEVTETDAEVTVTVYEGSLPGAGACIELAVEKATEVRLAAPLGDRELVDGGE